MPAQAQRPQSSQQKTSRAVLTHEDALARFKQIRDQYQEERESGNFCIYGFPGTGKTYALATARRPVLIYQFDPGGADCLRNWKAGPNSEPEDLIESGAVMVIPFDPADPDSFKKWELTFSAHKRAKLFDHVGTVVIDSLTTWSNAMSIAIFKANGREFKEGGVLLNHEKGSKASMMVDRDYGIQLTTVTNYMGLFAALPCDSIVIAHAKTIYDRKKDFPTESYEPLLNGQQRQAVPLMFSEVYVADTARVKAKRNGKDVIENQYIFRTERSGKWVVARSRFNLVNAIEPQDFRSILKKAGREFEDLPY